MNSRIRFTALALTGALIASPIVAKAAWEGSANIGLTSDYVFRGISQTDENPAIQGGFDLAHDSGFYVGTWASNVDFNEGTDDDADMELDVYVGFAGEAGDFSYDVSLLRYIYPGSETDFDYNELLAKVGYMGFGAEFGYSNDIFNSDENGFYYGLSYSHDIMEGLTASAGVGYSDFNQAVTGPGNPDSYMDYHVGIAKEYAGFGFDLSWYDTNSDGGELYGDVADGRVVFSISKEM